MCQEYCVARLRPALGTLAALEACAPERDQAAAALEAGYEALRSIERRLHPTRAGSELARLNAARAGARITAHPTTVAALALSRRLHLASGGRFEPALPGHGTILDWCPAGPRAVAVRRRARIDLGGIAKGLAVDLAAAAMRTAGATSGVVNAGGDLRVFGSASREVWLRGADGAAHAWILQDCALAASDGAPDAAAARQRPPEHRGYYGGRALGRPCASSAAVLAPSAALADGLTKVLMQCSPARAAAILARFRARTL
jgi:thiamine biosynthesis lipoprotein